MWCIKCNNELNDCTCPDLKARLASLGTFGSYVVVKWCTRCDNHYSQCHCPEPNFMLKRDGRFETIKRDRTP